MDGDMQIVTVSSVGAYLNTPRLSAYQPAKLAIPRLSEFVYVEYGDKGVVASYIHPGDIASDFKPILHEWTFSRQLTHYHYGRYWSTGAVET